MGDHKHYIYERLLYGKTINTNERLLYGKTINTI